MWNRLKFGLNKRLSIPLAMLVRHNSRNKQLITLSAFEENKNKSRDAFLEMLIFFDDKRNPQRRNHVDFIYKALKHMKEYGVEKDLEVYKLMINLLPKGKYVAKNIWQAELMHYPLQQECITFLLEKMEDNGVMPDYEIEDLLMNIFGSRAYPLRKFWRMMYWMPKFKNASPWPLPKPMPTNTWEVAQIGVTRIVSCDSQANVETYQTSEVKDSIDKTWIVSGQSPVQKLLLAKHPVNQPLYVEGPFKLWLRNRCVNYFTLKANTTPKDDDLKPQYDTDDFNDFKIPVIPYPMESRIVQSIPTIHEQEFETVFAICATGTSSHDSLLSWIRILENQPGNESMKNIPILFKLQSILQQEETKKIENNPPAIKNKVLNE